jgi:hypothetical protein
MVRPRLVSWLGAPWWIIQLATGAKSFVNRRGLHLARVRLAHRLAGWRRRRLAHRLCLEDRIAFDRDGFVEIRNLLPADEFDRLREALLLREFPAREHRQGDTITRRVAIGPQILAGVPSLSNLLSSRRWRGLMNYVAGTRAEPIYYLQTIIAGKEGEQADPQTAIHSDAFQPSLKAWLFLTNVADNERPLTYVPGSHRLNPARKAWEQEKSVSVLESGDRLSQRGSLRISSAELGTLGLPQPYRFAVPANTLVVADTYGFHARADANQPTIRVEIFAYCRRSPFLPWIGLDLLSLPGLAERRAEWAAAASDWLDRRGWRQQHWAKVGNKRATER